MAFLHTLILGFVEGLTEFLPVSSTGHLILTSSLLNIPQTNFQKSFEISIQLGAILGAFFLYWKKFLNMENLKRIAAAFIPTGIIGFALYKIVKQYLLGDISLILWSLFLGGVFLLVFETFHKHNQAEGKGISEITIKQSVIIGFFQAISIIPGVSRSAATIVGGLLLGLPRKTIVEFSFILAVPTMFAATGLDLLKNYKNFSSSQIGSLGLGFIISFIVAVLAMKWFIGYIGRHNFKAFGIYRIVVSSLFFFFKG